MVFWALASPLTYLWHSMKSKRPDTDTNILSDLVKEDTDILDLLGKKTYNNCDVKSVLAWNPEVAYRVMEGESWHSRSRKPVLRVFGAVPSPNLVSRLIEPREGLRWTSTYEDADAPEKLVDEPLHKIFVCGPAHRIEGKINEYRTSAGYDAVLKYVMEEFKNDRKDQEAFLVAKNQEVLATLLKDAKKSFRKWTW